MSSTDQLDSLILQRDANAIFPVSPSTRRRWQREGIYPLPVLRRGNRVFYSREAFVEAMARLKAGAVKPGPAALEAASFLRKGSDQ